MLQKFSQHYLSSFKGLPRDVWTLSIVVLINRSGSMVLFFMTLYLTTTLDFTVAEAGRMVSVYGLGAIAGAFIGGWLTDKIGTTKVQTFSLFFSGVGFIILNHFQSSLEIAGFLFVLALVNEAFRPANATAIANVCPPEKRTRAFGLNRLAINLGVTVGPAVGGLLATINYDFLFWADGLTCIAAALCLYFLFRDREVKTSKSSQANFQKIKSPYKDYPYIVMLFFLLLMGVVFVQLFNTWPLYLKNIALLNEDSIGLLMALNAILVAIVEMPVIHKLEKRNQLKIMSAGSLLLFGGFAILPFSLAFIYIAFTVVVWSIGEILVFPLASGFIANRADETNRGKYMGMFTFSFALSFVIGPALGTFIYETFGPDNLWYACGVLGIFVSIGFIFLNRHLKKSKDKI